MEELALHTANVPSVSQDSAVEHSHGELSQCVPGRWHRALYTESLLGASQDSAMDSFNTLP